jgi:hypothetical protein
VFEVPKTDVARVANRARREVDDERRIERHGAVSPPASMTPPSRRVEARPERALADVLARTHDGLSVVPFGPSRSRGASRTRSWTSCCGRRPAKAPRRRA